MFGWMRRSRIQDALDFIALRQLVLEAQMNRALTKLGDLEMTQAELKTALDALGDQLVKATNEIVAAIAASGSTTPAVDAAVIRLQAVAQALDDLNPDAPPPGP